jgi:hypothetical protein
MPGSALYIVSRFSMSEYGDGECSLLWAQNLLVSLP